MLILSCSVAATVKWSDAVQMVHRMASAHNGSQFTDSDVRILSATLELVRMGLKNKEIDNEPDGQG